MRKIAILTLVAACGGSAKDTTPVDKKPETIDTTLAKVGLDAASIDKSVSPCDDFYQFACGGWLKSHEIPADKSSFGRFHEINERNEAELKKILDELVAEKTSVSPELTMVRDYYGACMDEKSIEEYGTKPLAPLTGAISKVRNKKSLQAALRVLHQHRIFVPFSMGAEADFKDATKNIAFMDQSGLGLPDRDYYLTSKNEKQEESMKKLRAMYKQHIAATLELGGYKKAAAAKAATEIFALEKRLAAASTSRVDRRDPAKLYNPVTRTELAALVPSMDWAAYFGALGDEKLSALSVTSKDFFKHVEKELKTAKASTWRHYLTWHVLQGASSKLGKKFVDESFKLQAALSGQKELRPRWKRCLSATNGALGEYLAQPYIERMFPGASKESAEAMVKAISAAFESNLQGIDWMTKPTKAKAEEKRAKMEYLIGYPAKWKQYDFKVSGNAYAANALASAAWETKREVAKVGKPYDRSEWFMVPQIVNAYYNPLANQMVFPAGILQPPFFNPKASEAVNLGAMGMIVGHELTHGFDDSGAKFAANGNMSDWWQDADKAEFEKKGQCVIDQYNEYEPIPGKKVNGKLTLGENIADIGGVKLAYRAYRKLRRGETKMVAEGYSEDQQFFLAVGQAWCSKMRDAAMMQRLVTDPHSPAQFRVNGALVNQPEFAEAFQCKKGTAMNPKKSCDVW